jgi:hypothetical protein
VACCTKELSALWTVFHLVCLSCVSLGACTGLTCSYSGETRNVRYFDGGHQKTEDMNVDEIHYENWRWVELAQDRV